LDNLLLLLLAQIERGHFAAAMDTLEKVNSVSADPAVCTQLTLDQLRQARVLTLTQQGHLKHRLRILRSSGLYRPVPSVQPPIWDLEA